MFSYQMVSYTEKKDHSALATFSSHLKRLIVENVINLTVDCSCIANIVELSFIFPVYYSMITIFVNAVGFNTG